MYTAEPRVTRTTAGSTTKGSVVFEHEIGKSTFKLIPMETKGKRTQRSKKESWTIPLSVLEEVTLKGRRRATGGGVTIEEEGSEQITFKAGQREYRGSAHIKVTVGSGGSRTELVMTRDYITVVMSSIRELRDHPEKYS